MKNALQLILLVLFIIASFNFGQSISIQKLNSEQNVFQAEDGLLSRAEVQSMYSDFTGKGYVYLVNKTGAYVEILFRKDIASLDTIFIYYSNGSGSIRNLDLSVNETSLGNLSFNRTSNWSSWATLKIEASFLAGVNHVRLSTLGTSINPLIDKISISGSDAIAVFKLNLLKSGDGTVSSNPSEVYFNEESEVSIEAVPSGNSVFNRWLGTTESHSNPLVFNIEKHITLAGVFLDTAGLYGFNYRTIPEGFASINSLGVNGTTGGEGGSSVLVYDSEQLWNLMLDRTDSKNTKNLPPLIVYIIGSLSPTAVFGGNKMLDVKDAYNISIIGVGNDAVITGFGLSIVRSKNIIVRNIKFAACPDDGISLQANDDENLENHIWIDHCSFTDTPPTGFPTFSNYDGELDISHTVSYVTVSYCHFMNHSKTSLVGHSDSNTSDSAMKVTYHHNYFDQTVQRHPRVRFAKVHVYNNYYRNNSLYGVSSNINASVLVEGCYFENVPIPTESGRDGGPEGDIAERNNVFINCGTAETRGTVFDPKNYYSYQLDDPNSLPQTLTKQAGSGIYDFSSFDINLPVELESFNAAVEGRNVLLTWNTKSEINNHGFEIQRTSKNLKWNAIGFVSGKGTSTNTNTYSFSDKDLPTWKYLYRLKQIDFDGSDKYSNEIEVNINSPLTFLLSQNYPNPFNPTTKIKYTIPFFGTSLMKFVQLKVYDILGRDIATLVNEEQKPGIYEVEFKSESSIKNLSSGIYFYRIAIHSDQVNAEDFIQTKKMMFVK